MQTPVRLTPREAEVLTLIARGCTYAQAARHLGISAHAAATYIKSSYYKLGVHTAGAAVMRAVELGLLGPVGVPAEGHASIASLAAVRVLNTGAV